MVLTLISSTVVLYIHSFKNYPMPPGVETRVLRPLATVFCMKIPPNPKVVPKSKDEENTVTSSLNKLQEPTEAESKKTHIIEENGFPKNTNHIPYAAVEQSRNEQNKWVLCAMALERMFLVIWLFTYLSSMGILVLMAFREDDQWEEPLTSE